MRVDLFERVQARRHGGHVVLARAHVTRAPLVFNAGARQLRLAGGTGDLGRVQAILRAAQRVGGHLPLGAGLLEFGGRFAGLLFKATRGGHGPLALRPGVIVRGVQRGDGVQHRVDIGAGALDVLLERLDRLLRPRVLVAGRAGQRGSFVSRQGRFGGGQAAALEGQLLGFAAGFELLALGLELFGPGPAASRPAAYRAQSAAAGGGSASS